MNLPDDSPLWDLLARWEHAARQGQELTPDELAGDHPDLLPDLRRAIAGLRATAWLNQPLSITPKTSEAELPQVQFGDYELLDLLGVGGMGRVLKARHRLMDRVVALKLLKQGTVVGPDATEQFQEEVRTAARLLHPNIVTAYDAGLAEDGTPFLIMEFVDGPDLGRLVREQGPMAVPDAIKAILQAATGLHHAHQQGIVHLDVKPSNLLRGPDGGVKVLDMGLAHRRDTATALAEETLKGTVDYLAPEVTLQPRQTDERSDIYSLGCTFWFLLTGEPIFPNTSVPETIQAHRHAPVPSLRTRRGNVPPGLDRVFQQMVAKRPEDRFQSMAKVIAALKPFHPEERARQWRRGLLGLLLVSLLGFSGVLAWFAWHRPQEPEVVGTSQADLLFDNRQDDIRAVSVSSDGRYVLSGSFNTNCVRLWDATTGKLIYTLAGHTKKVHGVCFSPDGRLAASGGGDDDMTIRLWSVKSGELVRIIQGHAGGVWTVAFLPNGQHLLSSSHDNTLRLWNIESGDEVRKYEGHTRPVFKVAVSPDGEHALSGGADNHVIYWHLPTGKILNDFRGHATAVWCVAISPDGRRGLSGDQAGIVRVWNLAEGREERKLLASTEAVFAVAWHPDGRRAITTGGGGWRSKHEGDPHVPGQQVYAKEEVNDITLWDCNTGQTLHHFTGHTDSVWGLASNPGGDWFISGSRDKTLRRWRWP